MNLSLSKYFKLGYRKFLIPMIKKGIYRLEAFDDNKQRIMATTFYIDGDVFTELYTENDKLLVETNKTIVEQHLKKIEENVGAMDVLYAQIQAAITLIVTAFTYILASREYGPTIGAAATFGVSTVVVLIREYLLTGVIWVVKNVVIPLVQR